MYTFEPIGQIRSPFTRRDQTPIQPYRSQAAGRVELLPDYEPGLRDLDGFSHVILFYKPYVPPFDAHPTAKFGWLAGRA